MAWSSLDEWWREAGEAELRLILWAAWDPIGLVPRDEYDDLLPRLWELLREYAVAFSISEEDYEKLSETERDQFHDRALARRKEIEVQLSEWRTGWGCSPDPTRDEAVTTKLAEWLHPVTTTEFAPGDLPA